MSELNLILVGYAMAATLLLILVINMRRTTQPPTIVVQRERDNDNPLGCGAFLIFVLLIVGAMFLGIVMN